MNTFNISGRLTAEPLFKVTPNGKAFVYMTIINNVYNGQGKDDTKLVLDVTGWKDEKRGFFEEINDANLSKGQEISLSGRLNLRTYTNKDGADITRMTLDYPVYLGAKPVRESKQASGQIVNIVETSPQSDDVPF